MPHNPRGWNLRQTPVVDVVKRVKDSVVNIHSERTVRGGANEELFTLAPSQHRVNGMGTGIVIDPRGYILTNQHVVDDVAVLRVRLADGSVVGASVLARDVESDLALLKVKHNKPLPVMPLGSTKDLSVGETVVAIGNAYGYDHTVTVGIVSAMGRDVSLNKDVRYRSLIQTDASINPGNSGGPLINLEGDLIGVNVAIRAGAQGIGFAIPVDNMIKVAGQMLAKVRNQQGNGSLGLEMRDEVVGPGGRRKVLIERVGGSAGKSELGKGDEICQIGDVTIQSTLDVERALMEQPVGKALEVKVRRGTGEQLARVVLDSGFAGERLAPAMVVSAEPSSNGNRIWRQLGLRLGSLNNSGEISRVVPELHGGLLISDVRAESPAAKAGMRAGDILVGLHLWEMVSVDNVVYVLNRPDRQSFSPLQFHILRSGTLHKGRMTVSE
jgi:serine protease Do